MNGPEPSVKNAAALIYKALQTSLTTAGDMEYRELAALFRVDANFRRMCEDVAAGLTLQIIDASELRGLVLVPESKDSRFAVRLGDIRAHGMEQPTGLPWYWRTLQSVRRSSRPAIRWTMTPYPAAGHDRKLP